ncbi:hypothetical protein ACFVH6_32555 [Spirillospora sp. NPDC127200]
MDSLATLNNYAQARRDGHDVGGLRTFVRTGGRGALISASILASGENQGVHADEWFHRARTFPVRPATHPSGRVFFGAHIRLGSGQPSAPRLRFLDDTVRTRVIYAGYIGAHLPNKSTN